jgi:hypothetical protein
VGGSAGDVRNAFVLDTNIRAQYMFNKNWGVMMGIKYFNAEFDINKSAVKTEVSYGYDGAFLGLAISF